MRLMLYVLFVQTFESPDTLFIIRWRSLRQIRPFVESGFDYITMHHDSIVAVTSVSNSFGVLDGAVRVGLKIRQIKKW